MSLPAELLALKIKIANHEKKVSDLRYCILVIDRDISSLIYTETKLQQNLLILKKKDVVPLASEFKKAKEQLSKIKFEISQANSERLSMLKAFNYAQEELNQITNVYNNLLKNENNVIEVKFGRKNG